MENKVVLLGFWPSLFAMRVKIALAEKGIEYEFKEEDLTNKSPLLLEMNPIYTKVPVLIHNGKPICESLNIVYYIDEVWNDNAPLLPSDPYKRAEARFWADYVDKKTYEAGRKLWKQKGEALEIAAKEFIESMKVLEGELGEKSYFGGEEFGFMDVALAPYYSWLSCYEKFGNFIIEEECPKLIKWFKRCMQRESVSKSLPDSQEVLEFVIQIKKVFGI